MRTPRHVLDVGTGTGILAFAAAKVLKRPVVAGDIDPEAVRVARENARLNGIAAWMRLYVGPGIRHAEADRPGHFDLVFANILAKRSEEHTSELQSRQYLVCRLLLEKKKQYKLQDYH